MERTYAVGSNNKVVRSDAHNGIWNILTPLGVAKNIFYDVMTDPLDSDKVFIVGKSGSSSVHYGIQYSTNAGATWNLPGGDWNTDPTDKWFYEVWVVNSNIIWAVGVNGIVVKSIDGGLNFNQVTGVGLTFPGDVFYTAGIHAISADVAVILGSPTGILGEYNCYAWKTIDGGLTWSILNGGISLANSVFSNNTLNPVGKANGIWMSSDMQRIVAGTGYTQQLSIDGGITFNDIAPESVRSGEHLTWFPTYNNPSIFKHTGGFLIEINNSTTFGNSYVTTKGVNIGDLAKTIKGAHFYNANDGYFTDLHLIYSSNNGGINETLSYTDADNSTLFEAIWTGPPYIHTAFYELVSCCDSNDIIYATITGGTIIDGSIYLYTPNGIVQNPDTTCRTINLLASQPSGTILPFVIGVDISELTYACDEVPCTILCDPCLCTRIRIIGTLPENDVLLNGLDCNNQNIIYTIPANGDWGEFTCAKFFDSSAVVEELQFDYEGNCIETIIELNPELSISTFACPEDQTSYKLDDCLGIADDIITNVDLSEVVGQVITLRDINNDPIEGCWQVFEVGYQPIAVELIVGVYKCFEYCIDCLPPAPEPIPLKPRIVDPNYTTGNCDPDIVEGVYCKHAEMIHKHTMVKRFAIKDCCPEDEDKINMDKEKIDLLLITSTNPTPDPCSTQPIINEYYFGRNDGDVEVTLIYTNELGLTITLIIPTCVIDCFPLRFCAVRGSITLDSITTFAVNETCINPNNCASNANLVFVRPCII